MIYDYADSIKKGLERIALNSNQPAIGNVIDPKRLDRLPSPLSILTTPEQARHVPHAIYIPGLYGDMTQQLSALVNGVDSLVLARPKNTRIFLLVYNPTAANLYFAFDQVANLGSLPIPPGGNLFMDNVVAQNDLHLFYQGGNINVPILYMNVDIPNTTF